ncbi:DNA polymerase III subunit beta [Verrucomicrobium spinosum]|uniref:DNA polymerase III subunit beta n=1 Tax=Verrucomicrobium spinosum TaxID=2736 RepID=UPI001E644C1B|nr:DNA polymerase III subunit beta [Verrucomicrobium spinosum]
MRQTTGSHPNCPHTQVPNPSYNFAFKPMSSQEAWVFHFQSQTQKGNHTMTPITLPVAELKSALSGFSKIIPKNSTLPVLQCLKIERTQEGWICLTATDLDRFVTLRLEQPAKGEPASLLVPFDNLQKVVKTCDKNQRIHLEAGPNNHHSIKFDLVGQIGETKSKAPPVEEYPEIPRINGEPTPVSESLRMAILDAMTCACTDDTRPPLKGVCVDVSKHDAHYVVGTDGHHLYSCNSFNLPFKKSLLIPRHKFLAWKDFNLDGEWKMKVSDTSDAKSEVSLQISSRRWRFITKQLPGNFPNWQQCVPDPTLAKTHLELVPDNLQAVAQVIQSMPCHDPKHQTIGIQWNGKEVALLTKQEPTDPWSRISIPDAKGTGPDVTIFCDRRYLSKALEYGLTTIGLIDEISPLRLYRGGRQMIIMPVRTIGAVEEVQPPQPALTHRKTATSQTSPTPQPPKPERNPMPAPTNTPPDHEQAPGIDQIVQVIGEARDTIVNGLNRLQDASKQLRQLQKGRRNAERGLQSVRATIQSLTRLRI